MANRYEIGKKLGKGSFATVNLCRRKNSSDRSTRQYFAIKVINITECKQQQGVLNNYEGAPNNNRDNDEVYDQPQQQNVVPYTIESLLQREIDVHLSVSSSKHPNIVQLYESFNYKHEITGNDLSALVLEYCSFGDLQGYIKRIRHERKQQRQNSRGMLLPEGTFLSSNQIKHALSQVLCGLSFLHSRGIVHRDIKPANVFLTPIQTMSADDVSPKKDKQNTQFSLLDCQIKLGDFGLANKMQDDEDWAEAQRTFCGTPSCIAPEVVMQADSTTVARIHTRPNDTNVEDDSILGVDASLFTQQTEGNHSRGYGQPADLWSTGCLLYTLIVGRNPFALPASQPTPNQDPSIEKTRRIQQIIERVKDNDWSVPANVKMNESMEQLLYQLLEASPRKRGTARKILSMHPFFQLNSSMPEVSQEKKIEVNDTLEKQNIANDQQEESLSIKSSDHSYLFRSDSESEEIEEIDSCARGQPSGSISAALSAAIEADAATLDLSLEVIEDLTKYQELAAKSRPQTEPLHTHWSEEDKALDDIAEISLTSTCQGIADLKEYHQAAAESSSIVSKWTSSSSTARVRQKIDKTDEVLSTIQIIKSTIGGDKVGQKSDNFEATEQLPSVEEIPEPPHDTFVSMKALDRLPIKKYTWVESLSDSTTVRLTLFCLGTEGLVMQRETGSTNDLWLHVSSDGEGILWGKLRSKSTSLSSITSRATQSNESLLMEAYSRAPTEFSKQTLSSLLSLKCNDIMSLYESLEDKINQIKATTPPKLTLHLYTAAPADNILQLVASTILLENEDIETKFVKDGTIIRLSSSDESITVRGETGTVTKLDVDFDQLKSDDSPVPSSSKRMFNQLEPLPRFVNNLQV